MKKPIILLFALLSACQPYMTYDEMNEEAERTGDNSRVEAFEKRVERAERFYENKALCMRSHDYVWVCQNYRAPRKKPETLDERMRIYSWESKHCGCADSRVFDDIFR